MNTPRLVSEIELFEAVRYVIRHVAAYKAAQMVLEMAQYPFEDVVESKIAEAGRIYAGSFA